MVAQDRAQAHPSDVSDDEWAFVAPYLALPEDAAQRRHPPREVFNGVRYVARDGVPWRMPPNDLQPWEIVHQRCRRWLDAGVFEAMVHDLNKAVPVVCVAPWVTPRLST